MCGIAGALSLGAEISDEDFQTVQRMTEVLFHRGPDHSGYRRHPRYVLGNSRLNIIDLTSHGNLPMASADGKVWLAYNGEVTNFKELRQRYSLDDKYAFRSTSDTEVVLNLYLELGIAFLNELSGMFALTICDERSGKAYVVRDFFGIRPLFYMEHRGRLYFASEIKSLLEVPGFEKRICHEAMYHFLSLAYIPDELTPFEGLLELQGGELLELNLERGGWEKRSYYEPPYDTDASITEASITQPLYEQMLDSVRRNLIADAPLGLTLSGGFDTGSMLALAREAVGAERDVHTFSIVMDEPSFDESAYQRLLAEKFRSVHHEVVVGPRAVLDNMESHMAYMDEPSGDGAAVPSYILAEYSSKYVRALLSGEGGDETFNAYETHGAYKMRKLYRACVPKLLRRLIYSVVHALPCNYSKLSFDFLAKRFTEGAEKSVPDAHYYWRHACSDDDKRRLMPNHCDYKSTARWFSELYDRLDFPDELNRISLIDLKYFFIGDLMVKNDRTFMAHSIEARFPYMDRILFEFVSAIPTGLRIKGLKRRYIQKQAVRSIVPKKIYQRKNMGLEMPHSLWFLGEFRQYAEAMFTRERIERTGFLSYEGVQHLWGEHLGRKRDNGRSLWCILNAIVWFELFVYNSDYKKYLRPHDPTAVTVHDG